MRLPRFLRKLAMIEGLKLIIFTYKWGKVKIFLSIKDKFISIYCIMITKRKNYQVNIKTLNIFGFKINLIKSYDLNMFWFQ